jgi:hypothetical protein
MPPRFREEAGVGPHERVLRVVDRARIEIPAGLVMVALQGDPAPLRRDRAQHAGRLRIRRRLRDIGTAARDMASDGLALLGRGGVLTDPQLRRGEQVRIVAPQACGRIEDPTSSCMGADRLIQLRGVDRLAGCVAEIGMASGVSSPSNFGDDGGDLCGVQLVVDQ